MVPVEAKERRRKTSTVASARRVMSVIVVGFMVSLGLAACGMTAAQQGNTPQTHVEGSRAETFTSMSQLISASSSVIVGQATAASTTENLNGVAWTIQTVNVNKVLAGESPGSAIKLRQLGGTNDVGAQLVTPNTTYVLFVVPFHLNPGDQTGQWVVVGAMAGEYRYSPSDGSLTQIDRLSPGLPASLTSQQLNIALAATRPSGSGAVPPTSPPSTTLSASTTTISPTTMPPNQGGPTPTTLAPNPTATP